MKLDKQDIRILAALQRDGRLTKAKLSEEVFLSPTACWERIKKLEEAGIISSYHARINLEKLIKPTMVLLEVTLKRHQMHDFRYFEEAIQKIPEIVECHATGGGIDYMLKVVTPNVDHYQRLMDDLLERDIGIDRYFTYIVTKPVKETSSQPLQVLLPDAS